MPFFVSSHFKVIDCLHAIKKFDLLYSYKIGDKHFKFNYLYRANNKNISYLVFLYASVTPFACIGSRR